MEDARYFEGGKLVIFRRDAGFHARMKVDGKYLYRTLKTSHRDTAISEGRKLFYQLQMRIERGQPLESKSVDQVISEYVAYRQRQVEQGVSSKAMHRQVVRIVKFWREYLGEKAFEEVSNSDLKGYVDWRRDYYRTRPRHRNAHINPADKTIQMDVMVMRAILRWGIEKGYRGDKTLPSFCYTPKVKRARPAFEISEYGLLKALNRWIRECSREEHLYTRQMLKDYVLVLANSGIRVGELNNLRVRDLHSFVDGKDRQNYRLTVEGKTGARDTVPRAIASKYIDRQLARIETSNHDAYVFSMFGGSKVVTLADQFSKVLLLSGIRSKDRANPYTLYSLRHFYAVQTLRKGMDVFAVARNMGTSIQMIQAYYGRSATAFTWATRFGD